VDEFRAVRGTELPQWPDWCFLPLGVAHAILSGGGNRRLPVEQISQIGVLAALAAWRVTQGIYRFDEEILSSLWHTPIEGDLPVDILYRLPEWCAYIETPDRRVLDHSLHGFYAHLEWDGNDGHEELRLLLDTSTGLIPFPIHLDQGGLPAGIRKAFMEAQRQMQLHGSEYHARWDDPDLIAAELVPLVSLVIYLCSATAEYRAANGSERQPHRPPPKRTKGRERHFPAARPTVWETGYRIGAALRGAWRDAGEPAGGTHARPRPHIRRAHWHGFWLGPKSRPGERRMDVRWMPPLPVGVKRIEDLVPVIRRVE